MKKLELLVNEGISKHLLGHTYEEGDTVVDTVLFAVATSDYFGGNLTDAEEDEQDAGECVYLSRISDDCKEDIKDMISSKVSHLINKDDLCYL